MCVCVDGLLVNILNRKIRYSTCKSQHLIKLIQLHITYFIWWWQAWNSPQYSLLLVDLHYWHCLIDICMIPVINHTTLHYTYCTYCTDTHKKYKLRKHSNPHTTISLPLPLFPPQPNYHLINNNEMMRIRFNKNCIMF